MTAAPPAAVGRRSAARKPQPEPTPVRSALRGGGLLVLTGLLLLLVVLSTWIGTKDTTLGQVWTALWNDDGSCATDVIRQLRLPRTLVGLLTGAALGAAGAVMQAVTRNPLADPGLLGVNAGAPAAVVFGIGVVGLAGFGSLVWFSFVGAALTTVIVYVLGASGRAGPTPVRPALAGAAVSASLSGVIAGLTVFDSATYDHLRFRMVGSLAGREPELVVQLLPFVAVGLVIALLLARPLNSLALGEELGRALGARIARTRIAAVAAVTLLCGASTAAARRSPSWSAAAPRSVWSRRAPDCSRPHTLLPASSSPPWCGPTGGSDGSRWWRSPSATICCRWASPPPCWAGCTSPGCCSGGAAPGPRDGGAPGLRAVGASGNIPAAPNFGRQGLCEARELWDSVSQPRDGWVGSLSIK
ncbi:FecCD family ABC transporter permease [Streptomyces parvus]|uniref:FecCD family ABC transporter permease n=1 Tax=Streptomyces parvus TaxID=66428 RepID=UPI003808825F